MPSSVYGRAVPILTSRWNSQADAHQAGQADGKHNGRPIVQRASTLSQFQPSPAADVVNQRQHAARKPNRKIRLKSWPKFDATRSPARATESLQRVWSWERPAEHWHDKRRIARHASMQARPLLQQESDRRPSRTRRVDQHEIDVAAEQTEADVDKVVGQIVRMPDHGIRTFPAERHVPDHWPLTST